MKYIRFAFITGILSALFIGATVSAGNINGNEQSILAIVQGGFEYEGEYYVAAPGYVEKARSYLAQDDVDLNSKQASEAISEIYANVETAVKEGYIIPTSTDNDKDKDTENDEKKDSKPEKNPDDEETGKNDNPNNKENEKKETIPKVTVITGSSGNTEAIDAEGNRLFVAQSVIKDTGFNLSAPLFVLGGIIVTLTICFVIIWKKELFRYEDAS